MLALSVLVVVIWIYLFALHSSFWRIQMLPKTASTAQARVVAIIPARNEAEYISASVSSLLQQGIGGSLHIVVVDDNSSDDTGSIARRANSQDPSRLTVINGSPLPRGWAGKVWAMQQGWEYAKALNPDYILLTDADVLHENEHLRRLLAQAERGFALASVMARLHCESLAERWLIPAFVYFFFMLYPPRAIGDPRRRIAGAAGGCILVRAAALDRIAGFANLKAAVIDDCSLADQVKRTGGLIWLGVADQTRSLRPYDGWRDIRDMIARTAFWQLRHSTSLLCACVIGMLLVFVAPILILFSGSKIPISLAAIACLLMFGTYVPITRYYRIHTLMAWTLPAAATFYVYATMLSAVRYWRGLGAQWKDRVQDPT